MSEADSAVSVLKILEALKRRGGTKTGADPRIGLFETIREATIWTGLLSPQQVTTLKRNLMLLTGSTDVTIGIDTGNKYLEWSHGKVTEPATVPAHELKASVRALVANVLGAGWSVVKTEKDIVGDMIDENDTGTNGKGRSPAKPKRARSPAKAGKRRKSKT